MASLKYVAYRAAFEVLWASQLTRLIRRLSRCRGVIFTLHRVLPEPPADFSPNSILQVTPGYLEFVIQRLRALGLEMVSMDEALRRIEAPEDCAKFAVLSFDDAYKDNLVHALPILKRHKCPFTLYVPTAFVDGVGQVWWQALEDIIAQQDAVAVGASGSSVEYLDTKTNAQKHRVYQRLYQKMRAMPEMERVDFMGMFSAQYGLDLDAHCAELIMDWSELKYFANEHLCTIGAHTVHHYELAKLDEEQARQEILQSISVLKAQFAIEAKHFSYPIGGKAAAGVREFEMAGKLGLRSGVTTRPGGLYHRHQDSLLSLPRISLNGLFQQHRYVDVLATGAIFSALSRA
jgi:peptidoglycan/xylan/chitin deacetylase (PgdA/CDA1 family)